MWMRRIKLVLSSDITGQSMTFDTYDEEKKVNKDQLSISISGSKYQALLKDKGIITIVNLPYDKIVEIIAYEYYNIEIWAGYVDSGIYKVFTGGVSYISKKIYSHHDDETYICYASKYVAQYSQSRMKFYFNSGINLYAAYEYLSNKLGGTKSVSNIGTIAKSDGSTYSNNLLTEMMDQAKALSVNDIVSSITDGGDYCVDTDYINSNVINVYSTEGKRRYKIDPDRIPIVNGNPTLSSEGLDMYLLPVMDYTIGDIIQIPNSIINMSINQADVSSTFTSNYVDDEGEYLIYEMEYNFENRGSSFIYHIKARSLSVLNNLSGTESDNSE